jgi:hypothetical protein
MIFLKKTLKGEKMKKSEDLKKWIKDKVETLEAGETEILFSGLYPFLILYKSIKFIEIELLKDFSFYTDFNFDGIIEAICEANEEIRFQYRNKFQCYKRNGELVIDYLKPFKNLKEIGNEIEFFVSRYENSFNQFSFCSEGKKIAKIVKDDEFVLNFFKFSCGEKEVSKIFNKKNWNYFKCCYDRKNNESEFYFNNIEKMIEVYQEIKKIEILKPLKEEIKKAFSKEKEKNAGYSFTELLIDEILEQSKKVNVNEILKIYTEANLNSYSNVPEIETVKIEGKHLELICFQSSREDLLFQEPKVRFKEIFSIIRKIVESKIIDDNSYVEIILDFSKNNPSNFLTNFLPSINKNYTVRSIVFSGKKVSIDFYFYEEKEVLEIENYLKKHNFNVKLSEKDFGWSTK